MSARSVRGRTQGSIAAKDFCPERLVLAREARGLQKNELAELIETTPSAVGQFERGRIRPTPETVLRMSLALGVPPSFFAAEPPVTVPSEACHFRRLRSSTQQEQRRVRATGALVLTLARHLETVVDLPAESITALSTAVEGAGDPEETAEAVRRAWGLGTGPLANVVGLLEREGVIVVEATGHSERLDAFSAWVGSRPVVFLATDKQSASRRRFDTAHELGHLVMHADVLPGALDVERHADAFAAALLLPRAAFESECPRSLSWPRLLALKRRWKVSLAALVRRAYGLGIYSEATYRRAFVQLNERGWRRAEPEEPPMEHPQVLRRAVELLDGAGYPCERLARDVHLHLEDLCSLVGFRRALVTQPADPNRQRPYVEGSP
jgi:Zn-dependent peptidase ImmA (M78 family)/transcriptional regulator with XRE-family HTH domain